MKKRNILLILMLILSIGTIVIACENTNEAAILNGETMGDIAPIRNIDTLSLLSTHVIRGEVLGVRSEQVEVYQPREARVELLEAMERPDFIIEGARYYEVILDPIMLSATIYQIEILEVFRALDVFHDQQVEVGDIIEVAVGYGRLDLEEGFEYVLFLERHWEWENFFYIISNVQGAYHVPEEISEDEYLVESDDVTLELASAGEESDFGFDIELVLTIEDLIEIAEENGLLERDGDDEPEESEEAPDEEGVYGDGIDDEENETEEIENSDDEPDE